MNIGNFKKTPRKPLLFNEQDDQDDFHDSIWNHVLQVPDDSTYSEHYKACQEYELNGFWREETHKSTSSKPAKTQRPRHDHELIALYVSENATTLPNRMLQVYAFYWIDLISLKQIASKLSTPFNTIKSDVASLRRMASKLSKTVPATRTAKRYDEALIEQYMKSHGHRVSIERTEIWLLYWRDLDSVSTIAGNLTISRAAVRRRVFALRRAAKTWKSSQSMTSLTSDR